MEIWKPVKNYEGLYEISNFGRVKSLPRLGTKGKIMLVSDNGKGYFRIKLTKNNKEKRTMLHRIIAEAFIPNPNQLKTVNHVNGIKNDNRIENLEWCTQSENVNHAIRTGLRTIRHGSAASNSKLSDNTVLALRRLYRIKNGKVNMTKLGLKLNVGQGCIARVLKNITYKDVA